MMGGQPLLHAFPAQLAHALTETECLHSLAAEVGHVAVMRVPASPWAEFLLLGQRHAVPATPGTCAHSQIRMGLHVSLPCLRLVVLDRVHKRSYPDALHARESPDREAAGLGPLRKAGNAILRDPNAAFRLPPPVGTIRTG